MRFWPNDAGLRVCRTEESYLFIHPNSQGGVKPIRKDLPDVASSKENAWAVPINWVGMNDIELPVLDRDDTGHVYQVPARVSVQVSLDKGDQRGIHMSRLYTLLRDRLSSEAIDYSHLEQLLKDLLDCQKGLSQNARLEISFEKWIKCRALVSDEWGWRRYPVRLRFEEKNGEMSSHFSFEVLYSSTCPASAALARHDLIGKLREQSDSGHWTIEALEQWMEKESGGIATPHAQRSRASIMLGFSDKGNPVRWKDWIELAEKQLQTPVQTAVRREDEQEFARLNGQNNMFCEDAVRRLYSAFRQLAHLKSLEIRVCHFESLHPHDAVAEIYWP